jgi:hypothetical protein
VQWANAKVHVVQAAGEDVALVDSDAHVRIQCGFVRCFSERPDWWYPKSMARAFPERS